MTIPEFSILAGLAMTFLTAVGALIKGSLDAKSAKRALDKQIDDRVALQLNGAWARIDILETEVEALKRERSDAVDLVEEIRAIVRRWVDALLTWHREGHMGDLPLPSDEDLATLRLPRHLLPHRERQHPHETSE